jgi:hypothetical protein
VASVALPSSGLNALSRIKSTEPWSIGLEKRPSILKYHHEGLKALGEVGSVDRRAEVFAPRRRPTLRRFGTAEVSRVEDAVGPHRDGAGVVTAIVNGRQHR